MYVWAIKRIRSRISSSSLMTSGITTDVKVSTIKNSHENDFASPHRPQWSPFSPYAPSRREYPAGNSPEPVDGSARSRAMRGLPTKNRCCSRIQAMLEPSKRSSYPIPRRKTTRSTRSPSHRLRSSVKSQIARDFRRSLRSLRSGWAHWGRDPSWAHNEPRNTAKSKNPS